MKKESVLISKAAEISVAVSSQFDECFAIEIAMHPVPVPMSATRTGECSTNSFAWCRHWSTSRSVHDLGMSVEEFTLNSRPLNQVLPTMYWTGSWASARFTSARRVSLSSSVALRSAFAYRSIRCPPNICVSNISDMSLGDSIWFSSNRSVIHANKPRVVHCFISLTE